MERSNSICCWLLEEGNSFKHHGMFSQRPFTQIQGKCTRTFPLDMLSGTFPFNDSIRFRCPYFAHRCNGVIPSCNLKHSHICILILVYRDIVKLLCRSTAPGKPALLKGSTSWNNWNYYYFYHYYYLHKINIIYFFVGGTRTGLI